MCLSTIYKNNCCKKLESIIAVHIKHSKHFVGKIIKKCLGGRLQFYHIGLIEPTCSLKRVLIDGVCCVITCNLFASVFTLDEHFVDKQRFFSVIKDIDYESYRSFLISIIINLYSCWAIYLKNYFAKISFVSVIQKYHIYRGDCSNYCKKIRLKKPKHISSTQVNYSNFSRGERVGEIKTRKEQPSRGHAGRLPVGEVFLFLLHFLRLPVRETALRRSKNIIALLVPFFKLVKRYMPQARIELAANTSTEWCAIQLRYWGMYPYFSKA